MDRELISLFLKLPAEIRQMIWTYALGNRQLRMDKLCTSVTRRPHQNEIRFSSKEENSTEHVSQDTASNLLLLDDPQLRSEVEQVFYRTNLFTFSTNYSLQSWLAGLSDQQKSWVKAIGFVCPWELILGLPHTIEFVVLPKTVESIHLLRYTSDVEIGKGPKRAKINLVDDLDQTVRMIVRSDLKVKDISLGLDIKEIVSKDRDNWEKVRQSLVQCRDKALECLRQDPVNHAGSNPNQ